MRVVAGIATLSLVLTLSAGPQQKPAQEVAIQGEVLDQHCYMIRHGSGPDHAGCSNACINRNVSIGFLADDGQFYLLLGETLVTVKEKVAGMAGKKSTVTGFLESRDGLKAIRMKMIEVREPEVGR